MGTRSLVVIKDDAWTDKNNKKHEGAELVTMYRQYDGYPTGMGNDILNFFTTDKEGNESVLRRVNGISRDDAERSANGMGCLAAQLIARLKDSVGNLYIFPPKSRDCGEEYIYTLYPNDTNDEIMLKVESGCVTFFGMPGTLQDHMNVLYDGPVLKFNAKKAEALQKRLDTPPNDYINKVKKEVKKKSPALAKKINTTARLASRGRSKKEVKTVVIKK